jgi:hypothetical protein
MTIKILVWFILSYGLMNIMVFGSIFKGLRGFFKKWGENELSPFNYLGEFISDILGCPMCFSAWGGFVLSLVVFSPTFVLFGTPIWISWFFDGILSSGAVWAINSIIEWFELNRPQNNNQ